jgi:hypothetical protein
MRNVLDKIFEKIETHILCSTKYIFLFFDNRTVYELMWKNFEQPDRSQMTMWDMRIA